MQLGEQLGALTCAGRCVLGAWQGQCCPWAVLLLSAPAGAVLARMMPPPPGGALLH